MTTEIAILPEVLTYSPAQTYSSSSLYGNIFQAIKLNLPLSRKQKDRLENSIEVFLHGNFTTEQNLPRFDYHYLHTYNIRDSRRILDGLREHLKHSSPVDPRMMRVATLMSTFYPSVINRQYFENHTAEFIMATIFYKLNQLDVEKYHEMH